MNPKMLALGVVLGLLLSSAVVLVVPIGPGAPPAPSSLLSPSETGVLSSPSASPDASSPISLQGPSATAPVSAAPSPHSLWTSPHLSQLDLPGPHPLAWGPAGNPPGDPYVVSDSSVSVAPCDAVWPSAGGETLLPTNCVGHDEPSLSFYSDSPGSGGNISWNATLPQDGGSDQNQSDLYAAAWFGLVVSDPAAWLGQCYVEVQLYPDFSWNSPTTTVSGAWSAAVVGWQIDPLSGAVDTCFYAPLHVNGLSSGAYFQMTQGDNFTLNLVGWSGDPTGENVSILDLTTGTSTYVDLYNATGGFPLDPAYPANDVPGALLWTAGGQLPISFAFEIGRAGNPSGVHNSTYGGCTPGPSAPSPVDPSVPCPSYDPVSWVNDTLTPWSIGVPLFPGSTGATQPSQFDLSSTVGGASAIPTLGNGTCGQHIGSAFCTYPWFGYSCTAAAFTFGATDYATESNDFGESSEYPSAPVTSVLGLPVYEPTNFSVPSCGGPTHSITLGTGGVSGGSVYFLSGDYSSSSTLTGIPSGDYSISALPPPGAGFEGWSLSGSVSVRTATNPSTNLDVRGSGTVTALFTATPVTDVVSFDSATAGALTLVSSSMLYTGTAPATTIPAGGSVSLTPGVYGIQAAASPGYIFSSWSVSSGLNGIAIASDESTVTWLTVTGGATSAVVDVSYVAAAAMVTVNVTTVGGGAVQLGGVPYSGSVLVSVHAGTYTLVAVPAKEWEFDNWSFGPSSMTIDFNASTNVTFWPGVASIVATFAANITTLVLPTSGGRVALNGTGPLASGVTSWLAPGSYDLDALPFGYYAFSEWTVNNTAALWVADVTASITKVQVNSTGILTVVYQSTKAVNITFVNNPAAGGSIRFNFQTISGASTLNSTLANGTYLLRAVPAAGYVFKSWTLTHPPLSLVAGNLVVKGAGGTLTANFVRAAYGVSFVSESVGSALAANINDQTVPSGTTISLPGGKYPIFPEPGPAVTFLKWVTTGSMFVGNPLNPTTNLTVYGPGTLSAIADPFALTGITAVPSGTDVGFGVTFTAEIQGTTPSSFSWAGLPTGCENVDTNPLACVPTGTGSFSVTVTAKGPNGLPVKSSPLDFVVSKLPTLTSFTASPSTLDLGMTTNLTTVASGGTSPLSYSYSPLPSGCTSSDANIVSCTPTSTGSTTVVSTVTDAVGATATSSLTLSVYPDLVLDRFTTDRSIVTATVPFVLSVTTSGGAPSVHYTYTGLPASCSSANVTTLSCTPQTAGDYTIQVTAVDGVGKSVSATVTVTVNSVPVISSFEATPNTLTLGTNVSFSVAASGGTGSLTYSYSGLPGGCATVNASTFTCKPSLVGSYTVKATVTDADGVSANASQVVTVNSGPAPAAASSSVSIAWWVWVVLAVAIAAVVAALVVWSRRRSPPPAPSAQGAASPKASPESAAGSEGSTGPEAPP